MTADELDQLLESDGVVSLRADAWAEVAPAFEEVERHATGIAGDLVIVKAAAGPAAVETPSSGACVVRLLADADEVRRFVERRLRQYERMWDGCGCRIDYHGR